jgi:uncharacterized alkaline shock family protein YloU
MQNILIKKIYRKGEVDMVEGKITLSDSILVEIAREAMKKVEEVYSKEKKSALAGLTGFFGDRFVPQIIVKRIAEGEEEESQRIAYEIRTSMVYGVNIPEVGVKIREIVKAEVEAMTGYTVERIDITVDRLIQPEDVKKKEPVENSEEE